MADNLVVFKVATLPFLLMEAEVEAPVEVPDEASEDMAKMLKIQTVYTLPD